MIDQSLNLIAAIDRQQGIGISGRLPWRLKADMQYFKALTTKVATAGLKNAVIMGRKTWESIPAARRPLPERINVVITGQANYTLPPGVVQAANLDAALAALACLPAESSFVIGGGEIYRLAIKHPACRMLYLTELNHEFACDTFFPDFQDSFELVCSSGMEQEAGIEYAFKIYKRKNS